MSAQSKHTKTASDSGAAAAAREIYTISSLNEAARSVLERGLGQVWVEGEISNIARPASGHVYFTLKDSQAQIRCAMFRSRANGLKFRAENGLSVLAHGRVSLYPARGDYQLIVDSLEAAGDGLLRLRFEQLKRRLYEEGLFDEEHKRPLPQWPRVIGIVTSASGAAIRDIVTVMARRCPSIPLVLYPTAVQGAAAAAEIERAIETANRRNECDLLIVGRGGGSLEDLWCFNEERVARAIYNSELPVVSAVGHEIDITIADLVADLRAATPSAAAELVSPDTAAALRQLSAIENRLLNATRQKLAQQRRDLQQFRARLISPQRQLETRFQRVDELSERLARATALQMRLKSGQLKTLQSRIRARSPLHTLAMSGARLENCTRRLHQLTSQQLKERAARLAGFESILRAMGPAATLERGYAIVTSSDGQVIRSSEQVSTGTMLKTRLANGQLDSTVTAIHAAEGDVQGTAPD